MLQATEPKLGWNQIAMSDKDITPMRVNASSPKEIVRGLLRRVWAILLVVIVLTGSALAFSMAQTPTYEATSKMLIGQKSTTSQSLAGNVTNLQQLTVTMAKALPTLSVTQKVVDVLGLPEGSAEELLKNLSAEQEAGTMLIDISYRDPDPKRAQLIANTVAQVFSQKVAQVSPGANAITATVWEQAVVPEDPVSPDTVRNVALALVLGTFLGIGFALVLEYLDDSWDSPEEVEQISGVPTFGVIPEDEGFVSNTRFEILARKRNGT